MNDLIEITSHLLDCPKTDISKQVMGVCRAITPQFYKNLSVDDIRAEKMSIELLTADIDREVLMEMCKRAVLNYPKARSENDKVYFDINYILSFYKASFNFVHCDNVKISKQAYRIKNYYDDVKGILYQTWKEPDGTEKIVAVVQEKKEGRGFCNQYSPKDYEQCFYDFDSEEEI